MTLIHYSKRLEVIMQGNLPARRKDLMLSGLMTDMETNLNIPMFKNPEWESENAEVAELYQKVSNSRKL